MTDAFYPQMRSPKVVRIDAHSSAEEVGAQVLEALDAGGAVVVLAGPRRTGAVRRLVEDIEKAHPGVESFTGRSGAAVRAYLWPAHRSASQVWFYEA